MIRTTVNGKPRETACARGEEMALLDFLAAYEIDPRLVAVAINGDVVRKADFAVTLVRDGDALEIVRMVGGGAAGGAR